MARSTLEFVLTPATIAPRRNQRDRTWPRSPRALSSVLRRLAPSLRTMGVEVEFDRVSGVNRVREITIRRGATTCAG